MEGVVTEDLLGVRNLKKMRNKRLHPISAGNPTGRGRHVVQVLNGRYLHQHLPVQKFCPPDEVLADGCYPDISQGETILGYQCSERSCPPEQEIFLDPERKFWVRSIILTHPLTEFLHAFLE